MAQAEAWAWASCGGRARATGEESLEATVPIRHQTRRLAEGAGEKQRRSQVKKERQRQKRRLRWKSVAAVDPRKNEEKRQVCRP